MKKFRLLLLVAGLALLAFATDGTGRGGGGRGGGGGGGGGRGGAGGAARPSAGFTAPAAPRAAPAAAPRSAAGAPRPSATSTGHVATRPAGGSSGVGPGGGSYQSGSRSGSYTTQGGSTITYRGAGIGGTTAGGVSGGRYVGGVQITTPGGQTINKASRGSVAQGPGGNTAAKKSSVGNTYGAYGSGSAASRSAAVSGPGGSAATKAGVATGPGGTAAGRAGVATGPGGTAAYRTGAAVTPRGTYYRSAAAVSGQGYAVRQNFSNFAQQYPGLALRWAGPTFRPVAWAALASSGGYPSESTSYDYGSSVAYQEDGVYVNGENVGTPAEYSQQATEIAAAGKQAEEPPKEEFMSLGVFAMVQGEETNSSNIFQLAVSKTGVIRGEYYNALTDITEPVFGSVDKKTQRAAWTVGDKKTPVYEAGIFNLTNDQTTMMVHYSKDKSQQFTLFRIEKPQEGEGEKAANGEK